MNSKYKILSNLQNELDSLNKRISDLDYVIKNKENFLKISEKEFIFIEHQRKAMEWYSDTLKQRIKIILD